MDHSFQKIRSFVQVVEQGSIKGAAHALGLDISTVSRHLSALEQELGTLLLRRNSRKIAVTTLGRAFYTHYRQALDALERVDRLRQAKAGGETIHLTVPRIYGRHRIMPLIEAYLLEHPDTRIRLDWSDNPRDPVVEHFDIGIRGGDLGTDNIVARPIGPLELVLVASPALLERHPPMAQLPDLKTLPWIQLELEEWPSGKLPPFRDGFQLDPRDIEQVPLVVNDQELAIEAALTGLGVAIVERVGVEHLLQAGRLVEPFPNAMAPLGQYWLYKPEGRWASEPVKRLAAFLADRLHSDSKTPATAS